MVVEVGAAVVAAAAAVVRRKGNCRVVVHVADVAPLFGPLPLSLDHHRSPHRLPTPPLLLAHPPRSTLSPPVRSRPVSRGTMQARPTLPRPRSLSLSFGVRKLAAALLAPLCRPSLPSRLLHLYYTLLEPRPNSRLYRRPRLPSRRGVVAREREASRGPLLSRAVLRAVLRGLTHLEEIPIASALVLLLECSKSSGFVAGKSRRSRHRRWHRRESPVVASRLKLRLGSPSLPRNKKKNPDNVQSTYIPGGRGHAKIFTRAE